MDNLMPAGTAISSDDSRIRVVVDTWRRKLLDLSKRNRALNFKRNPVSTVAIIDELPAEVFRHIYLNEKPMCFQPAPEEASAPEGGGAGSAPVSATPTDRSRSTEQDRADVDADSPSDELADAVDTSSVAFVPYDRSGVAGHHVDDLLQTDAPAKKLDKSLLRLAEIGQTSIEEQGINTIFLTLGMLEYTEDKNSTLRLRAPLVVIPVQLERTSARSGFTLNITGDDAIINPALAEFLQRVHGIALSPLPEGPALTDDYDLQAFFRDVQAKVAAQPTWSVLNDIYVAPLSFQKFVMFKDLEANIQTLIDHRLVRQMVLRTGEHLVGLPEEIRDLDLDSAFPPESTFQVVDADSSQLRALAAVRRGYDCVIEGPPGTGKSQTITNLIAQALAAGESVLFVAEKKAALDVVHSRLMAAGLGEFCLELHSSKVNRRRVLQDISAALDASIQRTQVPADAARQLPQARHTLTAYVTALHEPFGTLGLSPFQGFGALVEVSDAPKFRIDLPIDGITRDQLEQAVRELRDLAAVATDIGKPTVHPWRDSRKTFLSEDDIEAVRTAASDLVGRCDDVLYKAEAVRTAFDVPPIRSFTDVKTTIHVCSVLARSPGAPLAVLGSERWNAPPSEAQDLIQSGQATTRLRDDLLGRLIPAALDQDHTSDTAFIERKCAGALSFLAITSSRYRSIKRRWLGLRRPSFQGSMLDQAADMRRVIAYRDAADALRQAAPAAQEFFGDAWAGETSDWDALRAYIAWVVEFRGVCVRHGLSHRMLEAATRSSPDISSVESLRDAAAGVPPCLATLTHLVEWPDNYLRDLPFDEVRTRVRELVDGAHFGRRWAAFETQRSRAAAGITKELLVPAMTGDVEFSLLPSAFLRTFLHKWLDAVVKEREPLRLFYGLTHEQRITEFKALDRRVLEDNRLSLAGRLRERTQRRLREPAASQTMPFLRKEMARQRRHSPMRQTLHKAEPAIRAIKPCFLMSPLTVAQYLDGSQAHFDLIVFDEASQLPPEDAVGAIARGKRVAVVGDPKQLPPTNFFSVMGGQIAPIRGEDGEPIFEDSESILEELMASGIPKSPLKWHYRSAHESLITFSNVSFYDSELYTFPSVDVNSHEAGLQFEYVPDGVYEGSGMNPIEARRVADAVIQHARTHPKESLGVGTFNMRQQIAIQDEVEQRRRADPSVESFFAQKEQEGFFVKNLENIQGDERDVIFLSVTYAKSPDGRVYNRFGPLNYDNGWRRLNVLTTRARKRMRVFSSIRCDDINITETKSLGASLLRSFLMYAERGKIDSPTFNAHSQMDSPFERQVHAELTRRGLNLVPQVGVAGYRIDFGVLDSDLPGRYVCGLECDGAAYHSCETARDRDRLRQQVLENRGWIIHRLWSTDWFKDRSTQVERLLKLVAASKEEVRLELEARWAARQAEALAAPPLAGSTPAESDDGDTGTSSVPPAPGYVRPSVVEYEVTPTVRSWAGRPLLEAPRSQLVSAVQSVVSCEAPIHFTDLVTRVAGMWGQKSGSRISARVMELVCEGHDRGDLGLRGDFVYAASKPVTVRSRAHVRTPADHISPEEYRAAVLVISHEGFGFDRPALVAEVRGLLGYGRSGAALGTCIEKAIESLLTEAVLGEGSSGITLRR